MEAGTKLALGILAIFGAMVCFYFAFHPGKMAGGNVKNPNDALQWLIKEFQATAGVSDASNPGG